jgi:hypothetical protein
MTFRSGLHEPRGSAPALGRSPRDMMKKITVGQSRHRTSDGGAGGENLVETAASFVTAASIESFPEATRLPIK